MRELMILVLSYALATLSFKASMQRYPLAPVVRLVNLHFVISPTNRLSFIKPVRTVGYWSAGTFIKASLCTYAFISSVISSSRTSKRPEVATVSATLALIMSMKLCILSSAGLAGSIHLNSPIRSVMAFLSALIVVPSWADMEILPRKHNNNAVYILFIKLNLILITDFNCFSIVCVLLCCR